MVSVGTTTLDHTQVNLTNCLLTLLNMCAVCYLECTCVNRSRQGFTLLSVYKEKVISYSVTIVIITIFLPITGSLWYGSLDNDNFSMRQDTEK